MSYIFTNETKKITNCHECPFLKINLVATTFFYFCDYNTLQTTKLYKEDKKIKNIEDSNERLEHCPFKQNKSITLLP